MRNWNSTLVLASALLCGGALAQQAPVAAPAVPIAHADSDPLIDALTCRGDAGALPNLLSRLRRERADDFAQTERQYSNPAMDLYRLRDPVRAWGHDSDAIVITANRVLMVVPGPVETATKRLEDSLAGSAAEPLSGALDDQHALVVYEEERPGLQQRVLMGCEYKIEGLSLLDDPADAWRRPPPPAPSPALVPGGARMTSGQKSP